MAPKDRKSNSKIRALSEKLRRNQTSAEGMLWNTLRNRQVHDLKWRRQYPIGNFIVDFYCAQCRLIVEVDGDSHSYRISSDERRTNWLKKNGYCVVRFTNREVVNNLSGVIDRILDVVEGMDE